MFKLKTVYFLPEKMIRDVVDDEKSLCIGIRDFNGELWPYFGGHKAAEYFAQNMPTDVVGHMAQLEYECDHDEPDNDRIQKADSLAIPIANFLKEHIDGVETIYVNCALGETRSYAIACAISQAMVRCSDLTVDVRPLGNHKRPDYAHTNETLQTRAYVHIRKAFMELLEQTKQPQLGGAEQT